MNPAFPAGFQNVTHVSPWTRSDDVHARTPQAWRFQAESDGGHTRRKGFVRTGIQRTFPGLRSNQEQHHGPNAAEGTLRERIP